MKEDNNTQNQAVSSHPHIVKRPGGKGEKAQFDQQANKTGRNNGCDPRPAWVIRHRKGAPDRGQYNGDPDRKNEAKPSVTLSPAPHTSGNKGRYFQ